MFFHKNKGFSIFPIIRLAQNNKNKIMQSPENTLLLLQKAHESLKSLNTQNPDYAISYLKDLLRTINQYKQQNPNPQLNPSMYSSIEIIAHNNLACAYNKKGKYKAGLYHLQIVNKLQLFLAQGSSKIIQDIGFVQQQATTHSNLCAVCSKMQDHNIALVEIKTAVQILEKCKGLLKEKPNVSLEQEIAYSLIVAYYNYSIQLQFLSNLDESLRIAQIGYELAKDCETVRRKRVKYLLKESVVRLDQKMRQKVRKNSCYIKNWQKGIGTYQKYNPRSKKLMSSSLIFRTKNTCNHKSNNKSNNNIDLGTKTSQIQLELKKDIDSNIRKKMTKNSQLNLELNSPPQADLLLANKFYLSGCSFISANPETQRHVSRRVGADKLTRRFPGAYSVRRQTNRIHVQKVQTQWKSMLIGKNEIET